MNIKQIQKKVAKAGLTESYYEGGPQSMWQILSSLDAHSIVWTPALDQTPLII